MGRVWMLMGCLAFWSLPATLPLVAQETDTTEVEPSACEAEDVVVFHCRLGMEESLSVCRYPVREGARDEETFGLQVRWIRKNAGLWQWPEERRWAGASFFFEEQRHVRSRSFHLWFEHQGEVFDIVDHWTEGSYDSHFAGWIRHDPKDDDREEMSCADDAPRLAIAELGEWLSHRPVP